LLVAVAGRQHADIDLDRPAAADPVDLPLLDRPQQLRLQANIHLADLIEQQGAAMGFLELADPPRGRSGEGPLFMAEKLGLEEVFRNGGTVDRDQRSGVAAALAVNMPGDHFLARAAFAGDQHAGIGPGDLLGDAQDTGHCRILGDHLSLLGADHTENAGDQFRVRRQGKEFTGPGANRADGARRVGIDPIGDDRQEDPLLAEQPDQVIDREIDVGEDQIRPGAGREGLDRGFRGGQLAEAGALGLGDRDGGGNLGTFGADQQDSHDALVISCRP
jgi:hypothetical protein